MTLHPVPPPPTADLDDDSRLARHISRVPDSDGSRVGRNALRDAALWLYPWTHTGAHREHAYPGRYKALRLLMSGAVCRRSIDHWMTGTRRAPDWVLERLADAIEDRARRGFEIARELREEFRQRQLGLVPGYRQARGGSGIGRALRARGERPRLLRE
jgi:hypothetical protein